MIELNISLIICMEETVMALVYARGKIGKASAAF